MANWRRGKFDENDDQPGRPQGARPESKGGMGHVNNLGSVTVHEGGGGGGKKRGKKGKKHGPAVVVSSGAEPKEQ